MKLFLQLSILFLGYFLSLIAADTSHREEIPHECIALNIQAHYQSITFKLHALSDKWATSGQVKALLQQAKDVGILDMVLFYKTLNNETLLSVL